MKHLWVIPVMLLAGAIGWLSWEIANFSIFPRKPLLPFTPLSPFMPSPKPEPKPKRKSLLPFWPFNRGAQEIPSAVDLDLPELAIEGMDGIIGDWNASPHKIRSKATVGGPVHPDGTIIQLDLPERLHQKNSAGNDGAGLCVYASARHSGHWHDVDVFRDIFDWMKQHPGGSWPEKFEKTMRQFCREKGKQEPAYLQVVSEDLEILKRACKAGLMPGITYSISPSGRYNGQKIAHMVTLVHADDKWFVIMDNNYPKSYEWIPAGDFPKTYATFGKGGWAIIPLVPGPPPIPRNYTRRVR